MTYAFDRMAADRFVHVTQLRVVYRAFSNRFTQVACLQRRHELFQQRYAGIREQIVTVLGGI
ncbi:hypothetical protein D3C86_2131300 [compost metagenome]